MPKKPLTPRQDRILKDLCHKFSNTVGQGAVDLTELCEVVGIRPHDALSAIVATLLFHSMSLMHGLSPNATAEEIAAIIKKHYSDLLANKRADQCSES